MPYWWAATVATIRLEDAVHVDSIIDNPSYFADPFATPSRDESGFVLPGLTRAIDLAATVRDPSATNAVMVWLVQKKAAGRWEKRLLFEDDGSRIRSASGAVLVAVDPPVAEGGERRAWLFVTGFLSSNAIAVEVIL